MAEEIGELKARITADLSGLQSGLTRAQNMMGGFGGRMKTVGAQVGKVGDALMGVSVVAAAGLGAGIKIASDFEGAMKEIEVRAGLTGDELEQVRAFALQMGADTAFSGQEAAEGLLQLLSSGNDLRESMELLKPVMDLAAASGLDLGYSADAATDIMAMFGLGVGDAVHVVNELSGAAGASSATTQDLIDALGNVGTVAAGMGYSFDETIAALAVLADNGMKGAEAGTRLKSALLNMHTNQDAIDALKELGVALYEPDGSTRPLGDVIEDLKTAMDGMDDQTKIQFLTDLGGAYGATALGALLAGTPVGDMAKKIDQQATAAQVAGTMTDTFAGRLEALAGSVEAVAVEALTPFMDDVLKPLVDEHLIPIVNNIGKWVKANPTLTGTLVTVAAVLALTAPLLIVVGQTLTAIGTIVAVGGQLITGLTALSSALALPVLPFLIAGGLVIGGFTLIADAANKAAEAAQKAKEAVTPVGATTDSAAAPIGTFLSGQSGTAPAGIMLQPSPDLVALEAMGYTPSTALEALAAGGLDPSTALEIIAALGIPPELSLQTLVDDGLLPSSVLEYLASKGLDGSTTLMAAIAHGLIPADELTALIAKGLTVTVNVPPVYQGVAERDTIPRGKARARGGKAEAGETYIVGDGGEPEVLQMGADSGYITPLSDISGGRGGGAPIIIQNLSIFANSVEELYDQIRGEAGRRGERMAYA